MKELKIQKEDQNQRLDKYIKRILPECSISFIYKQLRKKNITLNDNKATGNEKLVIGDCIKIFFSDETFDKFSHSQTSNSYYKFLSGVSSDIDIIFEDKDLIIINKPVGILSQKAVDSDISINEMALSYMINSNQLSESDFNHFHPSVVNRLDRNTSGIILFAKNLQSTQKYTEAIKDRAVKKIYHAIVLGNVKDEMQIEGYLAKDSITNIVSITNHEIDGAKKITTAYWPIKHLSNNLTLIGIHLITGRTHQIRAHLASIKHPILGDFKYGNAAINRQLKVKHQLLHAYSIEFEDGKKYVAKEPKEFNVNF